MTRSTVRGTLSLPSSKSHTHRALLFALCAEGISTISSPLESTDTHAMLRAVETLGAKVDRREGRWEVTGVGGALRPTREVIEAGNSGIILRFIGALTSLLPYGTILTGDHSLQTLRSTQPLLDGLNQLGALAISMRGNGYAPIFIKGPLKGGECTIEGRDSQPVSALLIASSFAKQRSIIRVTSPGEHPWIDLTLSWLDFLGLGYENHAYQRYVIPGGGGYRGFTCTIPGDLSSLAFPVAAALITGGEVRVTNVNLTDVQGDKKFFEILLQMGAHLTSEGDRLYVRGGNPLTGVLVDVNPCIDALPILAVMGCFATGETCLINGEMARQKECDRIHVIATELKKMGGDITENRDGLLIRPSPLRGSVLESHGDHRVGMALTVAALGAEGDSSILGTECIAKTYPSFKEDLVSIGAKLR